MTSRVRASILAITFAALVALPSIAAAQTPLQFGVLAGANIATLKFEGDSEDVKSLVGLVAGPFVQKPINDSWMWRLGAYLSQKGAKDAEAGEDAKNKLTYVDVPLTFHWSPASTSDTRFNLYAGPQLGINTGAKFVEEGQPDIDFKDEVKSTEVAAVIGAGLTKGRFLADVSYALGLTNIRKDEGDSVKNNVFSVKIGVIIK